MKNLLPAAILALATAARAQDACSAEIAAVPTCAVLCIEKASESFGCEIGNYNCLCGFIDDLVGAAGTCVFGACSDPFAVLTAANAACACLAAVPETPPSTTTTEPETPPPTTTPEPETPTPTPPPFNGTPIQCDPFAAKIPECAKACFNNAAVEVGCGSYDYGCQCAQPTRDQLTEVIVPCVAETCIDPANPDDVTEILKLLEVAEQICKCAADNAPVEPSPTTPTDPEPTPPPPFNGTPIQCDPFAAKIPECAKACFNNAAVEVGCGAYDYGCQCAQPTRDQLTEVIVPCVAETCIDPANPDDVTEILKLLEVAEQICKCAADNAAPVETPTTTTTDNIPAPTESACSDKIAAVPTCALAPINKGGARLGCSENDYGCLCANYDALIGDIAVSVLGACGGEAAAVMGAASAVCECIGEGTDPEPTITTTTTSISSTTTDNTPGSTEEPLPEGNPKECDPLVKDIPECAVLCLNTAAVESGCDQTDYLCKCNPETKAAISKIATPCVIDACPDINDLFKTIDATNAICKCADENKPEPGETTTPPPGGDTSTTTTSDITTTPTDVSSTTTAETTTSCETPTPTPVCVEEIAAVPTCAVTCIDEASTTFGCAVGDYNCLCGFIDDLVGAAGTCVFGKCSDPVAVLSAANAACACLAAAPPQQTNSYECPAETTTPPPGGGPDETTTPPPGGGPEETTTPPPGGGPDETTTPPPGGGPEETTTPPPGGGPEETTTPPPGGGPEETTTPPPGGGPEETTTPPPGGGSGETIKPPETTVYETVIVTDTVTTCPITTTKCADNTCSIVTTYTVSTVSLTSTKTITSCDGGCPTKGPQPGYPVGKPTTIYETIITTDVVTDCPVTETHVENGETSYDIKTTQSTVKITKTSTVTSCEGGCETPAPGHEDEEKPEGEEPEVPAPEKPEGESPEAPAPDSEEPEKPDEDYPETQAPGHEGEDKPEGDKPEVPAPEKPEEESPEAPAPGAEEPEKPEEEIPEAPTQPTDTDIASVPQESEPPKFTGGATSISVSLAAVFVAVVAVL